MDKQNKKKTEQLGQPYGTAANRLRKTILFQLLKELNRTSCHRCGDTIEHEADLSIEHKTPWLDSEDPKKLFFDLDNIAFSHLHCNISAARKQHKFVTDEERQMAQRHYQRKWRRHNYTKEMRRAKYLRTGT